MSMTDVGIFENPTDDPHPQFARVLMGYDPEHVDEHLGRLAVRVEHLERELRRARAQSDAATQRFANAREEVYGDIAVKMADVLRAADRQAEKLLKETREEARRVLAAATREAEQARGDAEAQAERVRADAEAQAERLRIEGELELQRAREEAARVLGALLTSREVVREELGRMREQLASMTERLDQAISAPPHAATVTEALAATGLLGVEGLDPTWPPPAGPDARADPAAPAPASGTDPADAAVTAFGVDDLLASMEGFDMVLPPAQPGAGAADAPPAQGRLDQAVTEIVDLTGEFDGDGGPTPPDGEPSDEAGSA